MKSVKYGITLPCIALIAQVALVAYQSRANDASRPMLRDYIITFRLSPEAIVPYQSLWVRESITNGTQAEIPIPNLLLGGPVFKVSISDAVGRTLSLSFPQGHFGRPFTDHHIDAEDSVINYCDLGNSLWDPLSRDISRLEPGLYNVRVAMARSVFSESTTLEDSVVVLPFRVLAASDQELRARELYVKAYGSMAVDKNIRKSRELLHRLIAEYPESPLYETAYQLLFFIDGNRRSPEDTADWVSTGKEILRRIPDSPFACEVAMNLKRKMTSVAFDSLLTDVKLRSVRSPLNEVRFQDDTK